MGRGRYSYPLVPLSPCPLVSFPRAPETIAIISTAASAARSPAWPWVPPMRSNACCSVFVVRTPKMTGRASSTATRWIPRAASPAT